MRPSVWLRPRPRASSTATASSTLDYLKKGKRILRITIDGRPGNSYTFNLVVGKNRIEVASVTVQDWTGETLAGGQATEGI